MGPVHPAGEASLRSILVESPAGAANGDGGAVRLAGIDERLWVALVILAGCLLHAVTSLWFPAPWLDEIAYSDPPLRWMTGKGFTSTAWPSQNKTEFWASNSPLHELLLCGWLSLFGVSATAVRTINHLLAGLAVWLLCSAVRRGGWVKDRGWVVVLAVLLMSAMSMTRLFRYGRPDAITLLVSAAALHEFAACQGRWRRWYTLCLGVAVPWAGLQLGAYAVGFGVFALLFARSRVWRFAMWIGVGMAIGVVTLLSYFAWYGVAMRFLENTVASGHAASGDLAQIAVFRDERVMSRVLRRWNELITCYQVWLLDPSYRWVMASLFASALWAWSRRAMAWNSALGFGLVAGLGVPVFVLLSGKYPWYYAWMGLVIAALCAVITASRLWTHFGIPMRVITVVLLLAAGVVGAPMAFWKASRDPLVDWRRIEAFFREHVDPSDHVLVTSAAYYPAIAHAAETYYTTYAGGRGLREWPAEQRDGVTVMVIDPDDYDACLLKIGGEWVPEATLTIGGESSEWRPKLTVYRRASPAGAETDAAAVLLPSQH